MYIPYTAMPGGQLDNPLDPREPMPLEMVVRTLAHICRWNGRCSRFYSVLDHSILLSRIVPQELAGQALVHDFAEAYTGDFADPIKKMPEMEWFRERESVLDRRMWKHYGGFDGMDEIVFRADHELAKAEANQLGLGGEWSATALDVALPDANATMDDFRKRLFELAPATNFGGEIGSFLDRCFSHGQDFPMS